MMIWSMKVRPMVWAALVRFLVRVLSGILGGGFSGGMIVGDREIGSLVNEDGAEDFGNGGDSLIG
jgi:hypothetical protein